MVIITLDGTKKILTRSHRHYENTNGYYKNTSKDWDLWVSVRIIVVAV